MTPIPPGLGASRYGYVAPKIIEKSRDDFGRDDEGGRRRGSDLDRDRSGSRPEAKRSKYGYDSDRKTSNRDDSKRSRSRSRTGRRKRSVSSRRSSSSSSSSYCSTCSDSDSHSLVSCSTCSGYYSCSTCSSSSSYSSSRYSSSESDSSIEPRHRSSRDHNRSSRDHNRSRCRGSPEPIREGLRVRFFGREELARRPLGALFQFCGSPPLDAALPRDPRRGRHTLRTSLDRIFPEPDANWVFQGLPESLYIRRLPLTISSKAQLYGLLEGHQFPADFSKSLRDIELYQRSGECLASITFVSGQDCYQRFFDCREQFSALGWAVSLDPGQRDYKRRIAVIEHVASREAVESVHRERDRQRHELQHQQQEKERQRKPVPEAYKCNPRVTCILVDYEFFPFENSSRDLACLFSEFKLVNVERHRSNWHVHLETEEQVEEVYSRRYSFEFRSRRIRPYLSERPRLDPRPARATKEGQREENLDRIRDLVMERTMALPAMPQHASFKIFEPLRASAMVVDEKLVNLPTFNKKYLEKLQELANAQAEESDSESDEDEHKEVPKEETLVVPVPVEPIGRTSPKKPRKQTQAAIELEEGKDVLVLPEALPTCSRLMGYYKQVKKTVWFEPIIPTSEAITGGGGKKAAGRTGRRNDSSMLDLLGRMSSLNLRQKQVILGRSSIHSYGLFAGEDIESGELVIEYVGEVIRHSVANIRERRLEAELRAAGSNEMASSYFFRLDLIYAIDATSTGNVARFINHSCDPNCIAKVVELEGSQHIVFYAKKPIGRGDEITYDYKFAIEDDPGKKIRCLCGMPACRKYLN